MLTKLAKWWLERRAHVVIYAPTFTGMIFGFCDVTKEGGGYRVFPRHPDPEIVALNYSVVDLDERHFPKEQGSRYPVEHGGVIEWDGKPITGSSP